MSRPSSARVRLSALVLALPCTAAAQQATGARLSLLAAVGTGSSPDLSTYHTDRRAPAILGSLGARLRAARGAFVDASVHGIGSVQLNGDMTLPRTYTPGVTYRELPQRLRGAESFAAADVRAGYEALRGGAALRASAGAGYLWTVRSPYASIAAGIGSDGRGARLTLDLEHTRFRVPVDEVTGTPANVFQSVVTRSTHAGSHATFVRLGVEVPLAR